MKTWKFKRGGESNLPNKKRKREKEKEKEQKCFKMKR